MTVLVGGRMKRMLAAAVLVPLAIAAYLLWPVSPFDPKTHPCALDSVVGDLVRVGDGAILRDASATGGQWAVLLLRVPVGWSYRPTDDGSEVEIVDAAGTVKGRTGSKGAFGAFAISTLEPLASVRNGALDVCP